MKLTSIQKIIIAGVVIGLAAAAVVVLLIVPMFAQLTQLEADRQAAMQQKQQADALLAQLEEAKGRAASTQAELLRIGTQLPDSPQLPTLIIELQDMANQSGVPLDVLMPEQPAPNTSKNVTEIRMTVNMGQPAASVQWADLLDFLRRLNKSTRLIRVTDLSITRPTGGAASTDSTVTIHKPTTKLSVALTMKAYVIGTNGQITPAEAAPAGGAAAGVTQ